MSCVSKSEINNDGTSRISHASWKQKSQKPQIINIVLIKKISYVIFNGAGTGQRSILPTPPRTRFGYKNLSPNPTPKFHLRPHPIRGEYLQRPKPTGSIAIPRGIKTLIKLNSKISKECDTNPTPTISAFVGVNCYSF